MESSLDEQGESYPNELAICARIVNYGGLEQSPLNGVEVELGPFSKENGWFATVLTKSVGDGRWKLLAGEVAYCSPNELEPLNKLSAAFIELWVGGDITFYSDAVYDLRDALAAVGVNVTAEALSLWTPVETETIWNWIRNMDGPLHMPMVKPKELP